MNVLIVNVHNLRVEWLATEQVLKKTCSGFVPSDVLRRSYDAVVACMERHRGTKALSDNRQMWPTSREDLEWIEREWLPRMLAVGWRTWAVLEPETSLGVMNGRRWISLYRQHGIEVKPFQDEGAALAWLRGRGDAAGRERRSAPGST